MSTRKVRIKNKEHFDEIFKRFAENLGVEFQYDLVLTRHSELLLCEVDRVCEVIGYENMLLDENLLGGSQDYCGVFYIDLIGIKQCNIGAGDFVRFFGNTLASEMFIEADGTLRIVFD